MIRFLFLTISSLFLLISCGINRSFKQSVDLSKYQQKNFELINQDSVLLIDQDFLRKNKSGNWELFLSGNPYELGTKNGLLTQKLYQNQEKIFFSAVEEMIGKDKNIGFLRTFLKWFNRDIQKYIKEDYKEELYAMSKFASDEYDFLAPNYQRNLYLHGAHDIGHAMNDLMLVGCSSFAVWDEFSENGELIVGRNFDFYLNDEFAENKLVQMIQPEDGFGFLSVSWPGFIGVASGMNTKGLTVTINAGKSSIPLKAKTPISLVVREILQYAQNIDQAIEIAQKSKVFVAESILVSSASDKKAVILEVSPKKFDVVYPKENYLISTNHFQGEVYQKDQRNQKQIAESHSSYRYQKLQEEIRTNQPINAQKSANILRDLNGLNDKKIGYGNEKALNQLLAHHGIIFRPEKKLVYVSSAPYNLGEFTVYDLNFLNDSINYQTKIVIDSLKIDQDDFVKSTTFFQYEEYKILRKEIHQKLKDKEWIDEEKMKQYISYNTEFWEVYFDAAQNFVLKGKFDAAIEMLEIAKTKEITTIPDERKVDDLLKKLKKKIR